MDATLFHPPNPGKLGNITCRPLSLPWTRSSRRLDFLAVVLSRNACGTPLELPPEAGWTGYVHEPSTSLSGLDKHQIERSHLRNQAAAFYKPPLHWRCSNVVILMRYRAWAELGRAAAAWTRAQLLYSDAASLPRVVARSASHRPFLRQQPISRVYWILRYLHHHVSCNPRRPG